MKRFEFQYESLATLAKRDERESATHLAEKLDDRSKALQRIHAIRNERRRALTFLESPDTTQRRFLSGFLEASGDELVAAHTHLEKCDSMIEDARNQLRHAGIERRRFDRLRERALENHQEHVAQISERNMDEIAMRPRVTGSSHS